MSQSKNGVAAKELQRHLGVTYKCAWRIAKQIRRLMSQEREPLSGVVEADETYIGGKREGKRGRGAKGKTRGDGWYTTLCDACHKKPNNERW